MRKLVIILTIAIMLFGSLKQRAGQSSTTAEGTPLNAAMEQTEKVPETNTEQMENPTEANCEFVPAENEVATNQGSAGQETPLKECADETKNSKVAEPKETVECIDKRDQTLAEYKPQPIGQPNPFENAPPAEIVDHPVEDIIGEGEDHPGEGKHF